MGAATPLPQRESIESVYVVTRLRPRSVHAKADYRESTRSAATPEAGSSQNNEKWTFAFGPKRSKKRRYFPAIYANRKKYAVA